MTIDTIMHPTQPRSAGDVRTVMAVTIAITETIREAHEVPAGVLYLGLMTKGCTMQQFDELVGILTGSGLVAKRGDMLVWIGPEVRS